MKRYRNLIVLVLLAVLVAVIVFWPLVEPAKQIDGVAPKTLVEKSLDQASSKATLKAINEAKKAAAKIDVLP